MLAYDVIGGSWHAVKMQYLQEVPQQGHRRVYCWWPGMIAFALLYYRVEHSHRPTRLFTTAYLPDTRRISRHKHARHDHEA